MIRRELGKTRLSLWAAGFVTLACVAILALTGWREWEARDAELKNAETDLANLARSLTQHAEDTFELGETILIGLVDRLETEGIGPDAIAKVQSFFQQGKYPLDRIGGVFVYGETGRWLATTQKGDVTGLNNSDRDYFKQHHVSPDRGTWVGRPERNHAGKWTVSLSRRFTHRDGSFAGVALTTVDVSYLSRFYEQFEVGHDGSIALLSSDGILLARSRDENTYVGRDLSKGPLFTRAHELPDADVYHFTSPLDGTERLSFYRRSTRYPIMIIATEKRDEVLASWRQRATMRMGFVAALSAFIAAIGLFLVRELSQRQRMAAALAAKEADFRLLAEQSSDMVVRIGLDEQIHYVSPSCSRILGWDQAQLVGSPALAGINADDLPRVEQTVAALKNGEAEEARIIYRNRHRDKHETWVETAMRVTRAPDSGKIDGVVAISRDVSAQKDLQDKLATLAITDGLTGLANRRQFDDRLASEWARARREDTPLSLLLIDVDHFKKFNDQYGHQAGDGCLRSLAQILADQARRPADLAARYGGEEFALLLPNTDAEGCAEVGERLREAVRDLGMLHVLNTPSRVVTVSIGGATNLPAQGTADPLAMVAAADRALYSAKGNGRDRLVMSGQVVVWPGVKTA